MKKETIINIVYLVLSLLLVFTAFFPVISLHDEVSLDTGEGGGIYEDEVGIVDLEFNGFEVMFGKKIDELSGAYAVNGRVEAVIKFNILTILVYFLPLIAFIIVKILKKEYNVVGFAMTGSFLISAILSFMIPIISSVAFRVIEGELGVVLEEQSISLKLMGFKPMIIAYIIGFISCASTIFAFTATSELSKKSKKG